MGVPAHDGRDMEFAKVFNLPSKFLHTECTVTLSVKHVVVPKDEKGYTTSVDGNVFQCLMNLLGI